MPVNLVNFSNVSNIEPTVSHVFSSHPIDHCYASISEPIVNIETEPPPSVSNLLPEPINVNYEESLKFMALNVCGLMSKIKFNTFNERILDYDFVCLSETKIEIVSDDEFPQFETFSSTKKCKSKKSNRSKHSGLAIMVKKNICNQKFLKILETKSEWILWLVVRENTDNID